MPVVDRSLLDSLLISLGFTGSVPSATFSRDRCLVLIERPPRSLPVLQLLFFILKLLWKLNLRPERYIHHSGLSKFLTESAHEVAHADLSSGNPRSKTSGSPRFVYLSAVRLSKRNIPPIDEGSMLWRAGCQGFWLNQGGDGSPSCRSASLIAASHCT